MKPSDLTLILGLALSALTASARGQQAATPAPLSPAAAAPAAPSNNDNPTAGTVRTFAEKGVTFNVVYCPPGTFEMGSTPEQQADALKKGAWPWAVKCETLHKVTLTKGFWMLDTQVNQELYKAVTGSLPDGIANPDPKKSVAVRAEDPLPDRKVDKRLAVFPGDKVPVHVVNFEEVTNFLKTLSKNQGVNFRLPTEAEWEYAGRAGTHTVFPNGDTLDGKQANYNYGRDAHHRIIDGKSYKPNAWGIYDIPGQLHEWCLDHCTREFGPDGKTPITMVVTDTYVDGIADPFCKIGDDKHYRICRNEGFEFGAIFCRVAFREVFAERTRIPNLGFRFVLADPIEDK